MKSLSLNLPVVKADVDSQGRMFWKSSIAGDSVDLADDRLDITLLDDLVKSFEAANPKPFLDVCHLSVDADNPTMFRAGSMDRVFRDGKHFKAEGFFDDTPLGRAAFLQSLRAPKGSIRTSVAIVPDWDNLAEEPHPTKPGQTVRVFKGGTGVAYFLPGGVALTSVPMNPADTSLDVALVRSDRRVTLEDDLRAVIGDEGLVREIIAVRRGRLRRAGLPDAVQPILVKANSEDDLLGVVHHEGQTLFLANEEAEEAPVGAVGPQARSLLSDISVKSWGQPVMPSAWLSEGLTDSPDYFLDYTNFAWPIRSSEQVAAVKSFLTTEDFKLFGYTPEEERLLRIKLNVAEALSQGKGASVSDVLALAQSVQKDETMGNQVTSSEESARAVVEGAATLTGGQPSQAGAHAQTFEDFIRQVDGPAPVVQQSQAAQPVQAVVPAPVVPATPQPAPQVVAPVSAATITLTREELAQIVRGGAALAVQEALAQAQRPVVRRGYSVPAGAAGIRPSAIITRTQRDAQYKDMSTDQMFRAVVDEHEDKAEQAVGSLFG